MKLFNFGNLSFLAAITCLTIFNWKGSYVGNDGILHESFFLIPVTYLFLFAGIIYYLIKLYRKYAEK